MAQSGLSWYASATYISTLVCSYQYLALLPTLLTCYTWGYELDIAGVCWHHGVLSVLLVCFPRDDYPIDLRNTYKYIPLIRITKAI